MVLRRQEQISYIGEDAAAPNEGAQVEGGQLSRLIELAVLRFGQVQPTIDFLWKHNQVTALTDEEQFEEPFK